MAKIKRFLKEFEKVFANYFYAVGISFGFSFIYSLLFTMLRATSLRATIDKYEANLIHFIVLFLIFIIALFIFFYKLGYKEHKLKIKSFSVSLVLLLILLLLFAYFVGHTLYVSGATLYLGDYLFKKLDPQLFYRPPIKLKVETRNLYQISTLTCAYIFIYTPIMIIAKSLGIKKHKNYYKKIKKIDTYHNDKNHPLD